MNRREFQRLAETRLRDAEVLLENRRYDAAYYLAGYVVECALKACIAKHTRRYDFPGKGSSQFYIHDLKKLAEFAFRHGEFVLERDGDPILAGYWGTVKEWSEDSRYEPQERNRAKLLLVAVGDETHGVLECIRKYW